MNIEIKDIETLILVATLPRSGSSMTCGILEECGAFGGKTMGNVQANKKGIFENRGLNQLVLNPILTDLDIKRSQGLMTLHKAGGPPAELFDHFYEDMAYGMNRQGYDGGAAYFKNGIYTFLFSRINEKVPDAVWILPDRNDDDVYNSHRRLHPKKNSDVIHREIADYRAMYEYILETAKNAYRVDTDKIVKGDLSEIQVIIESIDGLVWEEKKIRDWIDPSMWGGGSDSPSVKKGGNNNAR